MNKINFRIICVCLFLLASTGLISGCGDKALFDALSTNTVKVVIKGTYESNSPRQWGTSFPADFNSILVDSVTDPDPTSFMIDIASLRVISGKHHQDFADYRQTHSAPVNASGDTDPFFNGTGVLYRNDDMRPDFTWESVGVYIRKMLFDGAVDYSPVQYNATNGELEWGSQSPVEDLFRENTVNAFNFNFAQVLTYYDYLKMNFDVINRIFPLVIPFENGFVFDYDEKEVVMEIRLVIKNFVKKYEYEYTDSEGNRKLRHFYALSDWLRDVKIDEPAPTTDTMGVMGGNVLGVARFYVPGKTATITGNATSASRYVIAIRSGSDIADYYRSSNPQRDQRESGALSACDAPKVPRVPVNLGSSITANTNGYIENLLDYYLQNEVYKNNYDAYVNCVDAGTYETLWNDYNDLMNSYKIPPFATYVSSGTAFTLTDVPVGTYDVYESAAGIPEGDLPSTYSSIGTVTITEADFNGTVSVP